MSAPGSPRGRLPPREPRPPEARALVARALERLRRRFEREGGAPPERRYRIEEELARGGMGAVYRVWDDDLHRSAAMKVCLEHADLDALGERETLALQRFLTEAEITARLDHPGIVPVHEAGIDEKGRFYFTMRLVAGESLLDIVERDRDGWNHARAVRDVLLKVCEAVGYAHSRGIVHRDLKPSNVMVGPFGETYVMDWGLAVALDSEESRSGSTSGTFAYMAPEQALGEPADPRADVYSAGAILYHMLAGEMPYGRDAGGDAGRLLERMLRERPAPLAGLDPTLPPELVAICEKAMSRDPARRYATMEAMTDDLHAWLDGRVVHAYESGAAAELRKWIRRNPLPVALVAVVVGGLAIFAVVVDRQNEALAAEVRNTHEESYAANVHAAAASLRVLEAAEAKRRLADCRPELRHWEWDHLGRCADTSTAVLTGHAGDVLDVAFAPGGDVLASGSRDGTLRLWDAVTGAPLRAVDAPAAVRCVAFAPDGGTLVAGCADGTLLAVDPASGRVLARRDAGPGAVVAACFDPASLRLATAARDGRVRVFDPESWREILSFRAAGDPTHERFFALADLAISPDGARLLAVPSVGAVTEWDARTGAFLRAIDTGSLRALESARYRPDGLAVVTATPGGDVLEWDMARAEILRRFAGHSAGVKEAVYSADGARLATASNDGTLRLWDARAEDAPLVHLGHDDHVLCVALSPGGTRLASGSRDHTVRLWSDRPSSVETLGRGLGWIVAMAERPGGDGAPSLVAAVTRDVDELRHRLLVWDLGARRLRFQSESAERLDAVAFDPDGDVVWTGADGLGLVGWSAADGERSREIAMDGATVTVLAAGPSPGTLLAGTEGGEVIVVHTRTGALGPRWRAHGERVASIDARPGGRIATGSWDGSARIWSEAGEVERTLEGHPGGVRSVAFDPSGARIATACADGIVRVWGVATGLEVRRLVGHERRVEEARWSPDGARIVSAGADGTVRVWHAATGRGLLTLRGHAEPVTCARFDARGEVVVSGGEDGVVSVQRGR